MHHHECARFGLETPQRAVKKVTIGDQRGDVADRRSIEGRQLHLDDPPATVPRRVDAGMHGQTMQPGVEPTGVA